MVKLIIFDWDDVITLGAKEAYFACYHKALTELGISLPTEEEKRRILSKWSKPHREEFKALLIEHPELIEKACKIYELEKDEIFLTTLRILPGTKEVLETLSHNYTLAVSTGNTQHMIQDKIIPHFQIPNVFSQFVSSHDIKDPEKMKPHAYMLEVILKKHTISPNEAIYVGDALTDVQMARNAKVEPIVVLTGHLSKLEAESLGVKWIISDITDLPKVLNQL